MNRRHENENEIVSGGGGFYPVIKTRRWALEPGSAILDPIVDELIERMNNENGEG